MVETEQSREGGERVGWERVPRIDVVNFSVIVSRKKIQALSFALF